MSSYQIGNLIGETFRVNNSLGEYTAAFIDQAGVSFLIPRGFINLVCKGLISTSTPMTFISVFFTPQISELYPTLKYEIEEYFERELVESGGSFNGIDSSNPSLYQQSGSRLSVRSTLDQAVYDASTARAVFKRQP